MYYVNYPTCFPSFIQFMQSYGKYNNVQKFLVFLWIIGCKEKSQNSNKSWLLIYV